MSDQPARRFSNGVYGHIVKLEHVRGFERSENAHCQLTEVGRGFGIKSRQERIVAGQKSNSGLVRTHAYGLAIGSCRDSLPDFHHCVQR